jgi:uncharacterized protein YkwD
MTTFPRRPAVSAARLVRGIAVVGALIAMQCSGVALAAGKHRAPATSSASCADTDLRPTRANSARAEAATLCLVNLQRTRRGERALRPNADLARSAAAHSEEMVSENYFDHVSPAGETPLERIKASTYVPRRSGAYLVAENIALATLRLATPASIVASWMKSSHHRANILNRDFRDSGIGIAARAPSRYSGGQPGATYTQQFGVIAKR